MDSIWNWGAIDFKGQQLAEEMAQWMLIGTGVMSFLAGFTTQSLLNTFVVFTAGFLFTLALVVPPWPFFNRRPIAWLEDIPERTITDGNNSSDELDDATTEEEPKKKR